MAKNPIPIKTLCSLPQEGIDRVQVLCPGFSVDCLETLEEIAQENKDNFLHAGGKEFHYIPCLNDTVEHLSLLSELVKQATYDWQSQLRMNNMPQHKKQSLRFSQKTSQNVSSHKHP